MIKVLDKTVRVMELVTMSSPAAMPLARLALEAKINKGTCCRIVKYLLDIGYLDQVSRQEGYVLGPASFTMASRAVFNEKLIELADRISKTCAKKTGESVLFAVRRKHFRYILAHHNYNPRMSISLGMVRYDDLCSTATGLVLLAYAGKEEIDDFLSSRKGVPESILYERASKKEFIEFLSVIRRYGNFSFSHPEKELSIIAFPVFGGDQFIGALGISCPYDNFKGEHREKLFSELSAASEKFSKSISPEKSFG